MRLSLTLLGTSFVAVRVGASGRGIQHPLVVHQAVIFVLGVRIQLILLSVPDDVMGLDDARPSRFAEGALQFVQGVLTKHFVIQLRTVLAVERNSPHNGRSTFASTQLWHNGNVNF